MNLLGQVADLDAKWFSRPWSSAAWSESSRDCWITLLKQQNPNGVHGFCLFQIGLHDDVAHLLKIVVAPGQRKRGQGKLLFLETLKLLPQHIESVYLEVDVNNLAAISFYEAFGFEVLRCARKFYSDGSDAFCMQASLKKLVKATTT